MQQLSHHTLSSVLAFSTFPFTVCPGFIWFNRLLLKARDGRRGVVRPMSAGFQRARQHKSSGRRGPSFSSSPAAVDGEQNGDAAPSTANAQIPLLVGLGPWRNVHKTTPCSFWANPTSYRDQPSARKWFPELLLFSRVRECEFCCGSWLFVDDESANGHHFFWTCGSLSSRHSDGDRTCTRILLGSIRPPPRKTVQEWIAGKVH